MKRKFLLSVFAFVAVAMLFFGCNTDVDSETTEGTALSLNSSVLSMSGAVATVTQAKLTATLTGSSSSVKWVSTDASIVTVTNDDTTATTLTAMGAGTARIVATTADGKLSASCKVTVSLGQTACHAVSDLAVSAVSTNSVTLTWTDSSDLTSVKIVCVKTSDSTQVSTTTIAKDVGTATITGLSTNSTGIGYTFNVYGVVNEVTSLVNTITATTAADVIPPANVTSLAVSATTDHTVTLTWTDPSDVDFNNVIITSTGTLQDGSSFSDITVNAGVKTATISKLSADTAYTFVVKTEDINSNISSDDLPSVTGTTKSDTTAPGVVTSVVAKAGRTAVKLTWTDPTDIDLKNIVIAVSSTDTGASVPSDTTIAAGVKTATITGLTLGDSYTFTLTTVDYNSLTGTSVTLSSATINPVPTSVAAATKYTGQIVVTWTDTTASETGITYTYTAVATPASTTNGETTVTKTGITTGTQKAVFSGLTVGTSYTFSVATVPSDSGTYTASITPSVVPIKVLWQIATLGEYSYSSRLWRVVPAITSGSYSGYHVIEEFTAGASSTTTPADGWSAITYTYWLVYPGLSDATDTSKFSLMASTSTGTVSGYYLYGSTTRSVLSGTYYANHWSAASYLSPTTSYPVIFFVAKADGTYIDSTSSAATFSKCSAGTSYTSLSSMQTSAGYSTSLFGLYCTISGTKYYMSYINTLMEGVTTYNSTAGTMAYLETTLTN
jgi:hypothetical protein